MSKLIACRSCDGAISRRARVCPHCGYPLKSNFFSFCRITVIVMAFLYVGFHDQMHALVDIPDPVHEIHEFVDRGLGLQSDGEVLARREEKLDPPTPSPPETRPVRRRPTKSER